MKHPAVLCCTKHEALLVDVLLRDDSTTLTWVTTYHASQRLRRYPGTRSSFCPVQFSQLLFEVWNLDSPRHLASHELTCLTPHARNPVNSKPASSIELDKGTLCSKPRSPDTTCLDDRDGITTQIIWPASGLYDLCATTRFTTRKIIKDSCCFHPASSSRDLEYLGFIHARSPITPVSLLRILFIKGWWQDPLIQRKRKHDKVEKVCILCGWCKHPHTHTNASNATGVDLGSFTILYPKAKCLRYHFSFFGRSNQYWMEEESDGKTRCTLEGKLRGAFGERGPGFSLLECLHGICN